MDSSTKLEKAARSFATRRDDIVDIVLFGSAARAKETPSDVDIMLIFINKTDLQAAHDLEQMMRSIDKRTTVTCIRYADLLSDAFQAREAYLNEGRSLLHRKNIAQAMGYTPLILFTYQLTGKTPSQRTRFYYALHGRNAPGVLHDNKCFRFSDGVIACPAARADTLKAFFEQWHIDYNDVPALIPTRMASMLAARRKE